MIFMDFTSKLEYYYSVVYSKYITNYNINVLR